MFTPDDGESGKDYVIALKAQGNGINQQ